MHDLMYANKIVAVLKESLQGKDSKKEIIVNVALGPFTHVTEDSLLAAFVPLAEKEGFGNARLSIVKTGIFIVCAGCGATSEVFEPTFACPSCGREDFQVNHSEEFSIKSIEVI